MLALSRDKVREVDRVAMDEYSVPGIVLMENAGRNASEINLFRADDLVVEPIQGSTCVAFIFSDLSRRENLNCGWSSPVLGSLSPVSYTHLTLPTKA